MDYQQSMIMVNGGMKAETREGQGGPTRVRMLCPSMESPLYFDQGEMFALLILNSNYGVLYRLQSAA